MLLFYFGLRTDCKVGAIVKLLEELRSCVSQTGVFSQKSSGVVQQDTVIHSCLLQIMLQTDPCLLQTHRTWPRYAGRVIIWCPFKPLFFIFPIYSCWCFSAPFKSASRTAAWLARALIWPSRQTLCTIRLI